MGNPYHLPDVIFQEHMRKWPEKRAKRKATFFGETVSGGKKPNSKLQTSEKFQATKLKKTPDWGRADRKFVAATFDPG